MHRCVRVLAAGFLTYSLVRLALLLGGEPVSLFWPANGAMMLILSFAAWVDWPLLVVVGWASATAANIGAATPLAAATLLSLCDASSWVAGGLYMRTTFDFNNLQELVRSTRFMYHLLLAPVLATAALTAVLGSAVTVANFEGAHFGTIWATWFAGDVSGNYAVLYAGYVFIAEYQALRSRPETLKSAFLASTTRGSWSLSRVVTYWFLLGLAIVPYMLDQIPRVLAAPVMMTCLPLLSLVASYYSQPSSALCDAIFYLSAVAGTRWGRGPITVLYQSEDVLGVFLALHMLLLLTTVTTAFMAVSRCQSLHHQQQQKQRADEKLAFFTHASHEFRTPLSVIVGFVEQVLGGNFLPAEARKDLCLVLEAALGLCRIVNDLLSIFRMEAQDLKISLSRVGTVAFMAWIESSTNKLAQAKGIAVTTIMEGIPAALSFDKGRLCQVALNLIDNAIKYTPPGGTVTVIMGYSGGVASISVRDTGYGISMENQARLFDSFFRCDSSGSQGAGLGLTISKNIMDAMGGDITVHSTLGEGSTFTISWPCPLAVMPPAGGLGALGIAMTGASPPEEKTAPSSGEGMFELSDIKVEAGGVGYGLDKEEKGEGEDGAGKGAEKREEEEEHEDARHRSRKEGAKAGRGGGGLAGAERTRPRTPKLHILVVEDSSSNRRLMVRILENRGHTTEVVVNGLEVVPALERSRFDLMMLDLGLPGRSGQDVLEDVRNAPETCSYRDIPVVVISGHVLDDHRSMCEELGANAFTCKPFRAENIEQGLSDAWNTREQIGLRRDSDRGGFHSNSRGPGSLKLESSSTPHP